MVSSVMVFITRFCRLAVLLLIFAEAVFGVHYPYKKCRPFDFSKKQQIWLKNRKCTESSRCNLLAGCTTFEGSLLVRESHSPNFTGTIDATFPALREITGYLIIFGLRTDLKSFDSVFPNLAVIRGTKQTVHYSLVVYGTLLEKVGLPSLTIIKSGGVRLDHNDQMCYIKTIKWRSIVLQKEFTVKNFGISFYRNNENCYDRCLDNHCIAPSGHESTRQQYCLGPGNSSNAECQKLCKSSCGPRGCAEGTMDQCCHTECLGGCSMKSSNQHCHACMNYRTGLNGTCVSKCPAGSYVVNNFDCEMKCPFWDLWNFLPNAFRHYVYDGKCVKECPAGYTKNSSTKHCDKCETALCPKVCGDKIKTYKLDGLSSIKELKGCTVVKSNIIIEIRAGPSNILQQLEENLGAIKKVEGYVKISESEVLTSLSFFKNLETIENSKDKHPYSLMVLSNSNLKSLWKPKTLSLQHGKILLHGNLKLCPGQISSFNKTIHGNTSGVLTQAQNGFLCSGDLQRFNITVYEITCKNPGRDGKCVNVTWVHDRSIDSRSVFYIVNYRISSWTVGEKVVKENNCSKRWCQKDVSIPELDVNDDFEQVHMFKNISNLIPFTTYTFFVETYLLKNGDGRKSYQLNLKLSEAIPGIPVGLKAAYLSSSAIEVTWQPPEGPNGVITEYRIFYEKKNYSFWNSDLNWCSRQISSQSTSEGEENAAKKNATNGYCRPNVTYECAVKEKESRRVLEDKNFALFNSKFEDELISTVFVKPDDDEEMQPDVKTTRAPMCSNVSNKTKCKPTTANAATLSGHNGGKRENRTASNPSSQINNNITLTPTPQTLYKTVDGKTLKYIIKDLPYFQEYNIKICPCNKAGCVSLGACPNVYGQTDASASADMIPDNVIVDVKGDTYTVNWTAPVNPNGVILRYDIRTRHKQNQEKRRCLLGNLPTTFVEKSVAPGNYSIRIQAITPVDNGTWTPVTTFIIAEKSSDSENYNSVVIGVGTASAFLIVLLVAFLYYSHTRRSASKDIPGVLFASANPEYLDSSEIYVPDEWEVPREKIQLIRELGKGSFGMVFEGVANRIIEEEPKLRVAVKTVNENASMKDRIEFLQEASIMKAFNCNHIVRLLGVVSQGQPTLVVMELMERGDLKGFLRSRRPDAENSLLPPQLTEILQMAAEIADGMSYLATRKFVHRDLAARNCMVAADFTVKIGDFGMTRDVYETDYYRKGGKGLLPVRWMPPESLYDGVFTTASDVWSYGVVLWEIATLGAQPYPGKSNEDVLSFVVDGGILEQPDGCSDRLYNMMCNCWKTDQRARPSFLEIVHFLENDVSEAFEEVSYYHEMKRRLLEAAGTPLQGPDQINVNQGRRALSDGAGESSLNFADDDDWKTEADRGMHCQAATCQGIENDTYASDDDKANVRYVELPI